MTSFAKVSKDDKFDSGHKYQSIYCDLFFKHRHLHFNMLEIGFGCGHSSHGSSAVVWKQLMSNIEYDAIDYYQSETCIEEFRSTHPGVLHDSWIGDQANVTFLATVTSSTADKKWDFIIDDGGHLYEQMITSLVYLWPFVSPGGYYIVEDIGHIEHTFSSVVASWLLQRIGGGQSLISPNSDVPTVDMPNNLQSIECSRSICVFHKYDNFEADDKSYW